MTRRRRPSGARPTRGPDNNGWYNRALTVKFSGGDALSGLAACSPDRTYAGPDSGIASVSGSCTDGAGNTTSTSFGFQYDATPPDRRGEARPEAEPKGLVQPQGQGRLRRFGRDLGREVVRA